MLPIALKTGDPDQGLGGGPDLGVHPELRADDRRLRRADHPEDHAARGAARHAGRRFDHVHLDAPALEMFMTPVIGITCFAIILLSWFGGVSYRRHARRAGRHRRRHGHRLGIDRGRTQLRRHDAAGPGRVGDQLRLPRAAAGLRPRVLGLRVPRRHSGDGDSVRHLRSGRSDRQRRERRGGRRQLPDHARADRRRRRQPDRLPDGQSVHQRRLHRPSRLEGDGRADRLFGRRPASW